MLKFISNEPNENESHCDATDICDDKIQNRKMNISKEKPKHNLKIKRQKISVDYSNKSFYEFRLIFVDPPKKLDSEESCIISGFLGISNEKQLDRVISNMALTHLLSRLDESKTQLHPSSIAINPPEHISLNLCYIILKGCVLLLMHLPKFTPNQ